jgi:hypothetical protein
MKNSFFLFAGLALVFVARAQDPVDAVNSATDSSIAAAKAATRKALRAVKERKMKVSNDDMEEQDLLKDIVDMNKGIVQAETSSSSGVGSTGSASGSTGATGATGATGSSHMWHFAPVCNERGSFHKMTKECHCHKSHAGKNCEFKKLNTGAYNARLDRHENHGRYVGATNCVNGEQIGTHECECLPGWAGYHCDKRECRGKWVCANKARFCTKPTVCQGEVAASTGSTGASTGATGGTGATGPVARNPLIEKLMSNAATGPKAVKRRYVKPKRKRVHTPRQ